MFQAFLVIVFLVGIAFVGLGFNIFFRKIKFPETEIGKNKKLREKGLNCAKCEERKKFNEERRFTKVQLDTTRIN